MTKDEAETHHRILIHQWAKEIGFFPESGKFPSFSAYKEWAQMKSSSLFSFRSRMGADYDVELWFDEELRQTWRR